MDADHALCGIPGAHLPGVRRVRAHPVAARQCRRALDALGCEVIVHPDPVDAARAVAREGDPSSAALAGMTAGGLHGLVPLLRHAADSRPNTTRFLLLSRTRPALDPRAAVRASVLVHEDRPPDGRPALHLADGPLAGGADRGAAITELGVFAADPAAAGL